MYVGPDLYSFPFCFVVVEEVEDSEIEVEMAGGRIEEVLDGEDGVEVGDVGRVWGENVID